MMRSQNEREGVNRVLKKRSCIACASCRRRKVRCDVARHGPPCLNCSTDEIECVIERKRKTRERNTGSNAKSFQPDTSPYQTLQKSDHVVALDVVTVQTRKNEGFSNVYRHHEAKLTTMQSKIASPNQFIFKDRLEDKILDSTHPGKLVSLSKRDNLMNIVDIDSIGCLNTMIPCGESMESISPRRNYVAISYYKFIDSSGLFNLSPEDYNFLEQKNCFRIPTKQLLDEIIKQYFLHVHPHLPILNEGVFWEMYTAKDGFSPEKPRLSLFVFQAMIFASCSFLPYNAIKSLGFLNARSARNSFYDRAKILFDFDSKKDSVTTAQGALLLSYHTPIGDAKMNTYWLSVAIHFARDAKAHQYYARSNLTYQERNIRKRLWWCCILRDRVISLGVRRPLQISPESFDVVQYPLVEDDFADEIGRSNVYGTTLKRSLIHLLLALFDLSSVLAEVIMVSYPLGQVGLDAATLSDTTAYQYSLRRVEACKSSLDHWFEATTAALPLPFEVEDCNKSLALYRNLMYLYYHSAKVSLYHHAALLIMSSNPSEDGAYWQQKLQIRRCLEEAVGGITENVKELLDLGLAKYLPISIVAYITLPLVLHVLDAKLSSSVSQQARKRQKFSIYAEVMNHLRTQYDGTDRACEVIKKMTEGMDLGNWSQPLPLTTDIIESRQNSWYSPGTIMGQSLTRDNSDIKEWGDLLHCQTSHYLRLSMTIDMSFSQGRYPEESEFPSPLQNLVERSVPLDRFMRTADIVSPEQETVIFDSYALDEHVSFESPNEKDDSETANDSDQSQISTEDPARDLEASNHYQLYMDSPSNSVDNSLSLQPPVQVENIDLLDDVGLLADLEAYEIEGPSYFRSSFSSAFEWTA